MRKKKEQAQSHPAPPLELPEGRPMPHEANPGGTEGADQGWAGGSSNVGEVMNPEPRGLDTTYSTSDSDDVPKTDVVYAVICKQCGEPFETTAQLNVHVRTHHRPRREAS